MANKEAEMTIEVGTVLRATKTGAMGTIVEVNDRFKTAIIEMEDGSSANYSVSTLKDKRRWLPVDAEEEEAKEATIEEENAPEMSEEVHNLVPMPGAEKLADLKKPVNKAETGIGFDIKDFILKVAEEIGVDICESKGRFISFKVNGKMCAGLFSYSEKSATIGTRSKATIKSSPMIPTPFLITPTQDRTKSRESAAKPPTIGTKLSIE